MTLNDINVTFTVLLFSLKRQDMFLYNFICNDVNCFFILILAEILSAIHRQVKRQLSQVQEVATEVQSWTISTPAGGKCAKILICHGRNSSNPAKQFIWVFICWCVMFVYIYILYIYYIYIWNPTELRYSPISTVCKLFSGVFADSRLPSEPKKRSRKWRGRSGKSEADHWQLADWF